MESVIILATFKVACWVSEPLLFWERVEPLLFWERIEAILIGEDSFLMLWTEMWAELLLSSSMISYLTGWLKKFLCSRMRDSSWIMDLNCLENFLSFLSLFSSDLYFFSELVLISRISPNRSLLVCLLASLVFLLRDLIEGEFWASVLHVVIWKSRLLTTKSTYGPSSRSSESLFVESNSSDRRSVSASSEASSINFTLVLYLCVCANLLKWLSSGEKFSGPYEFFLVGVIILSILSPDASLLTEESN